MPIQIGGSGISPTDLAASTGATIGKALGLKKTEKKRARSKMLEQFQRNIERGMEDFYSKREQERGFEIQSALDRRRAELEEEFGERGKEKAHEIWKRERKIIQQDELDRIKKRSEYNRRLGNFQTSKAYSATAKAADIAMKKYQAASKRMSELESMESQMSMGPKAWEDKMREAEAMVASATQELQQSQASLNEMVNAFNSANADLVTSEDMEVLESPVGPPQPAQSQQSTGQVQEVPERDIQIVKQLIMDQLEGILVYKAAGGIDEWATEIENRLTMVGIADPELRAVLRDEMMMELNVRMSENELPKQK